MTFTQGVSRQPLLLRNMSVTGWSRHGRPSVGGTVTAWQTVRASHFPVTHTPWNKTSLCASLKLVPLLSGPHFLIPFSLLVTAAAPTVLAPAGVDQRLSTSPHDVAGIPRGVLPLSHFCHTSIFFFPNMISHYDNTDDIRLHIFHNV